jgi:hypothetical protein
MAVSLSAKDFSTFLPKNEQIYRSCRVSIIGLPTWAISVPADNASSGIP